MRGRSTTADALAVLAAFAAIFTNPMRYATAADGSRLVLSTSPSPSTACPDYDAMFAARAAFIEAKVAPTPAQKAEWDIFVGAGRAIVSTLKDHCETQQDTAPPANDPIAMLVFRDTLIARYAAVSHAERISVERLMTVLSTDQQRKLAEAMLPPSSASPLPMMSASPRP